MTSVSLRPEVDAFETLLKCFSSERIVYDRDCLRDESWTLELGANTYDSHLAEALCRFQGLRLVGYVQKIAFSCVQRVAFSRLRSEG